MADKPALLPAYLIVGPDELKRKQAVARLRARVDGPFAAFNLEELVASGELEPVGVLASLNTLPMGGTRRVVIIENAEKLPKAVSEAIVGYLGNPNESCTLALVATTLAKSTRLYKAVAKVGPRTVIECAAKKGRDLPPYVQKLAEAHGVRIAPDAASELVARVGESTTMLDTQIATLAALLGGAGGTNFPAIEAARYGGTTLLNGWGLNTAQTLLETGSVCGSEGFIAATGGVRTGLDAAKCLALGADVIGMAGNVLAAAVNDGADAAAELITQAEDELRLLMLLTGAPDIRSMRTKPLYFTGPLLDFMQCRGWDCVELARSRR